MRFQGPRANGMPELHKLTPPLARAAGPRLQGRAGHRRAHERRLGQGAGRHPRQPGGAAGGPLGKLRDGDLIRLDAVAGTLDALVDAAVWAAREQAVLGDAQAAVNGHGLGRELFAGMRRNVLSAEQGACTWL